MDAFVLALLSSAHEALSPGEDSMRALLALVLLLAYAVPLRAAVWIVDAAGGGNFTDLPAAVAAAAPGDTLLMRAGRYRGATITRGLAVIAISPAPQVELESALRIENLAAAERVLVRQIAFRSCVVGISIARCAGAVEIEDVRYHVFCAGSGIFGSGVAVPGTTPVLSAVDCAEVILRRCSFGGSRTSVGLDIPAAQLIRSAVWIYDTRFLGAFGIRCLGQRGGLALRATQCSVLLSGCEITGGSGSEGETCFSSCARGYGGDGCDATGSHLRDFGSVIQGGFQGGGCLTPPNYIRDGAPWQGNPASYLRGIERLPSLVGPALISMGVPISFQLELLSPNPQILFLGFVRARIEIPGLAGTLWLDPLHAFPIGSTGSSTGSYGVRLFVPSDPLAIGWELYFQAVDHRGRFGAPASGVLY
jgi:hypothetical protein